MNAKIYALDGLTRLVGPITKTKPPKQNEKERVTIKREKLPPALARSVEDALVSWKKLTPEQQAAYAVLVPPKPKKQGRKKKK